MTDDKRIPVTQDEAKKIATLQHDLYTATDGPRMVTRAEWIKNRAWELQKNGARSEEAKMLEDGAA